MLIRIDPASKRPLAVQIAAAIRSGIADGSIAEGERLPTGRDLGAALGVNVHTVLAAYDSLRHDGVIDVRRGRGASVLTGGRASLLELRAAAQKLVDEAAAVGVTPDELASMIKGLE